MASGSTSCRHGLTAIEVLVALLIVTVLGALILPAIQQSRESARRLQCMNTLRQLGLALHGYHDAKQTFPYGSVGNPTLPPSKRWSWYLCLGNYWGHYGTPVIDYRRPWDDPALRPLQLHTWRNAPLQEFDVPLYAFPVVKCPNGTLTTHTDGQQFSDYVGTSGIARDAALQPRNAARAGAWSYVECTSLSDIRDGHASTLLAIETGRQNGCWLAGGPATVRGYIPEQGAIGRGGQFGGLHSGGSVALFADGHVRFLAADTSPNVLTALITIAELEKASSSTSDSR